MDISVIIPTCNRKQRLLSLLQNLNNSSVRPLEILVIDSGEDLLTPTEVASFKDLNIIYSQSERSVCIQRNIGVLKAEGDWVFLCDDDVEVPSDYLQKLADHLKKNIEAGVVSGLFLQKEKGDWQAKYSITSSLTATWHFVFQLSIWGEINCKDNLITKQIKKYYHQKGNHISRAGWPVITDFSGDNFVTPVYSLGASLVRKKWLINSPFDEVLDPHGIGDNYGVAIDFPSGIHILNNAFVYHHHAQENRLQKALSYYRRILALDYFRRTKRKLQNKTKAWFLWSLFGNLIMHIFTGNKVIIRATLKLIWLISFNKNPYYRGALNKERVIKPEL